MINLGADLHPIDQKSGTPFIDVLIRCVLELDLLLKSEFRLSDVGLDLWLSSLESCGVDLYEYGKREEELQESGLVRNEIGVVCYTNVTVRAKLASLTYGSSPGEWDFIVEWKFSDPDQDSGQVEKMPGGWIED